MSKKFAIKKKEEYILTIGKKNDSLTHKITRDESFKIMLVLRKFREENLGLFANNIIIERTNKYVLRMDVLGGYRHKSGRNFLLNEITIHVQKKITPLSESPWNRIRVRLKVVMFNDTFY